MTKKAESKDIELAQSIADGLTALSRHLRTIKLPDGMTQERLASLAAIDEHEPISVSDMAAIARVRVPTMSRMISSLADDGLVKRQGNKTDARGVLISLTPKGRRAYKTARKQSLEQLTQALGKLSSREKSALGSLATALNGLGAERKSAA